MLPKEVIRKIRHIHIRTRHKVADVFAGEYRSVFKGRGMEFQEVREYVPGDEIRSIDWNVTARMGHPFVKVFTEERELTMMILLDISASHLFGSRAQLKKDLAAELAAVLAFAAIQNRDRVGLVLFTDGVEKYVAPRKGVSHVLRVVREALYFQPARRGTRLAPALDFLNHIAPRRTLSFLLSDFRTDEDLERLLAVTARRHDLVALILEDEREGIWHPAGLVHWRDAETGTEALLDTSSPLVRQRLEAWERARRDRLLQMLRAAKVDVIELRAGEPYERNLMRFFRMREQRLRL